MFKGNPYKLPKDKFEYVGNILTRLGVTVDLEICDHNPFLSIADNQEYRDAKRKYDDESVASSPVYKHYKLILRRTGTIKFMYFSIDISTNNSNRDFGLESPQKGLYFLVTRMWCLYHGWEHLLNDNYYLWAEYYECTDIIHLDYLFHKFEYDRDELNVVIDILGEDIMTDIMNYFPICSHCKEKNSGV